MEKSRCWIELSKSALEHNLKSLLEYLSGRSRIIAIVKTDCYGHGCKGIVETMLELGITDFAVATLDEAIELRSMTSKGTILILGYVEQENWLKAYEANAIMTVLDPDHALRMNSYFAERGLSVQVEVKVDTGMNRIGTTTKCSDEDIRKLYGNANLKIVGTFSHLCTADSFDQKDIDFTMKQKKRFDEFLSRVKALGFESGRTHLCASSGIMNYPQFNYDYVRPGFIYFGFNVGEVNQPFERRRVLSWYSKVEMVKTIDDNQGISYGQTYHTEGKRKIATLSVGYGDGYPRRLSSKGYVLIRGKKAPIVGRICMDQMMVDVTEIPDVCAEDVATLIGKSGSLEITAEEFAEAAGTIVDEIVCDINKRVVRHFE
ncbi:MAG: alanine racemase [Erysipelotrichaceae bacterium]|nr:alanine racemase [Erysipelotrichaceae bacterium]